MKSLARTGEVMARHVQRCFLAPVAAVVLGAGCGKTDDGAAPVIEPIAQPEKAAARLHEAYRSAEPGTRTAIEEVGRSLKRQDYEGAAVGIQVLQAQPNRSFEQSQVLNGMMAGLQKELAEAADRGDPRALKAIEALKRSRGR